MIIPESFEVTVIDNNNLKQFLFVGSMQFIEYRSIYDIFPKNVHLKNSWKQKFKNYNPFEIFGLILNWNNNYYSESEYSIEAWGNNFVRTAVDKQKVIKDYLVKYEFESDIFILFDDATWDNDYFIYNESQTWFRQGSDYIILSEERINTESSLFIQVNSYDQFIKDTQELGDKLFL